MKSLAVIVLCGLAAAAGSARAQTDTGGVSYSTWIVSGNMITLRFVLPVTEAQRLTGAGEPLLTISRLEDYLLQHLAVQSAGGDCPAIDQGFDLGRVDPLAVGPDLYGFEIFYRCSDPRHLVLHDHALFERSAAHVDFARILARGQSVVQLFTSQHQDLALPDDRAVAAASLGSYLRLGSAHVARSADRWCFVLGLLLFVRRSRDAAYLVAALAGGYLLALTLASAGWLLPRLNPLAAFMGLLVGLLGAALTQREAEAAKRVAVGGPGALLLLVVALALLRAPAAVLMLAGGAAIVTGFLGLSRGLAGGTPIWPALGLVFTFLDGFVLPGVLPPAQLPQGPRVRMVIGFDLGALLSEALLVALAVAAWLLLRGRLSVPRAAVTDVCAAGLSGLGAFWLLSRIV